MLPTLEFDPVTVAIVGGFLLLSTYQLLRWRWRHAWWDRIQIEELGIDPADPDDSAARDGPDDPDDLDGPDGTGDSEDGEHER